MELSIYSIFDMGTKAYAQPFYTVNDGMAIRMFSDNVNSKEENMISKHPDQFILFKIGEFNDQSGSIESFEKPVNLGMAATYKVDNEETELKEVLNQLLSKLEEIK